MRIGDIALHVLTKQVVDITRTQWIIYQCILKNHIKFLNLYFESLTNRSFKTKQQQLLIAKTSYEIYNKLAIQANQLNSAFSYQILLIVPHTIVMLIYNSFVLSKYTEREIPLRIPHHVTLEIVSGVISLFSFVIPSSRTKSESNRFNAILRKVDTVHNNLAFDEIVSIYKLFDILITLKKN